MPFFQGTSVRIATGQSYHTIDKVQNVSFSTNISRAENNNIFEFESTNRPYETYPTVNLDINFIKTNKNTEYVLGLVSGESIISNLYNSKNIGSGLRNYELIVKDNFGIINSGAKISLNSGVLLNYSIGASVNSIAQCNVRIEALDLNLSITGLPQITSINTGESNINSYYDTIITGLSMTGFGLNDIEIQNFSLNLSLSRAFELRVGQYYPSERKIVNPTNSKVSLNGIINSFSPIDELSKFKNGQYYSGTLYVTMSQCCLNDSFSTTYIIQNPYIGGFSYSDDVGGYTNFSLDMDISIPLINSPIKSNLYIV